ncbi:MAG TPA: DUF2269 family protein [Candidatus Limnocylindrales bacterium]|jgi:hypothetical protein|nr:DUF2269 family protein [Candidatus Limnocylindrales bacterium]
MQPYLLPIFLYAHVLGAIITFGPAFSSPIIAGQARRMPQSGHFAAVLGQVIQSRIMIPGAIVQGITGVGLILIMGVDLTSSPWRWLVVAIVLYLITITFAIAVQRPSIARMVELTRGMAGAAGGPPPSDAPAGPPPELVATAARLQRGGTLMALLILVIVFLMVVKPAI